MSVGREERATVSKSYDIAARTSRSDGSVVLGKDIPSTLTDVPFGHDCGCPYPLPPSWRVMRRILGLLGSIF